MKMILIAVGFVLGLVAGSALWPLFQLAGLFLGIGSIGVSGLFGVTLFGLAWILHRKFRSRATAVEDWIDRRLSGPREQ